VFARGVWQHIVWVGIMMAVGTLGVFYWGLSNYPLETARTLTFLTLASFQLFHVMAIRSESESLLRQGVFSNPYLLGAVGLAFLLQASVIYLPFLQPAFATEPLAPMQFAIFFAVEYEKWRLRRRHSPPPT
jgi:Ca2+-transporting ATPase